MWVWEWGLWKGGGPEGNRDGSDGYLGTSLGLGGLSEGMDFLHDGLLNLVLADIVD